MGKESEDVHTRAAGFASKIILRDCRYFIFRHAAHSICINFITFMHSPPLLMSNVFNL